MSQFSNHATLRVFLRLRHDQELYNRWCAAAVAARRQAGEEGAAACLAAQMRERYSRLADQIAKQSTDTVIRDLLEFALDLVAWQEIAAWFLDRTAEGGEVAP